MKKSILALILAALLLFSLGCSKSSENGADGNSLSGMFDDNVDNADTSDDDVIVIEDDDEKDSDLPDGWVTENVGDIYLSYPEDDFDITTGHGADFQIIDDNGSNINIIKFFNPGYDISLMDKDYMENNIEYIIATVDSAYEESLGYECETEGVVNDVVRKTVSGKECAFTYYVSTVYVEEIDTTYLIDYMQIVYFADDSYYTVTFTHFPGDTGVSAEEYFEDIIDHLYISGGTVSTEDEVEDEDTDTNINANTDLPDGWVTENIDNISISYPEDDFDITTDYGADFQIIDDNGSNLNVITTTSEEPSVEGIDDAYVDVILEQVIELIDPVYEDSLGVECETTGFSNGAEIKTFGNGKVACLSYTLNVYIPDYDTTVIVDYYQLMYINDGTLYTITFTHFPYDTGVGAEEYFADILEYLYIA